MFIIRAPGRNGVQGVLFQRWSRTEFTEYRSEARLQYPMSSVRPLLVIGDPTLSHDYLDTLEAVCITDRRVLTFDPVGTGQSSSPGEGSFESH